MTGPHFWKKISRVSMFQIFIYLRIDPSSIAQISDFMLVRTLTSPPKHGILKIPRWKFGKVSTLATSQRFVKNSLNEKFRFLAWIWSWKTNNLESSTSSCWRYCYDFYRFDIIFIRNYCIMQGSVGRDESSWDGPRPSTSSGRDGTR